MVSLFKKTLENSLNPSQAPRASFPIADSYDMAFINRVTKSFLNTAVVWLVIAGIILCWGGKIAVFGLMIGIVLLIFWLIQFQTGKSLRFGTKKRIQYILDTPIPPQLWYNESLKILNLPLKQRRQVEAGLKDFFILHALYPNKPLAMPSTLVDKLWHAFILDTQRYETYCKKAFGKIFHHIPDYQFKDKNHNIQMFTWQSACRVQGLSPAQAMTIPRLFAVDMLLGTAIVSGMSEIPWQTYLAQMTAQYRDWHAQVFNNSSSCNAANSDNNSQVSSQANNQCDVGITSAGDCSCGGSGDSSGGSCGGGGDSGGGCGGGCGGGD